MTGDRLLAIDDEQGFTAFVGMVARECGFEAAAVTMPDEFRLRLKAWLPTVIVLDLQMPNVDGIELLRELAALKTTAKILLASGVDQRVLDTARQLGETDGLDIAGTIHKPIRAAELRRILQSLKHATAPIAPADIARAVQRDELLLHYQPQLDAAAGRLKGVEALIRWRHPTRGLLAPLHFLHVAEADPVIDQVTDWVARRALQQAGEWRQLGIELDMSINVSARNLGDLSLPDRLSEICATHKVPAESVTVELTETATMKDAVKIMDVLVRLRLKGFKLAIDDFGTGYSSLIQLRRLPFTELKIDKSFVADMLPSKDSAVIVRTIIDMAGNLGLEPVAEGVETEAALRSLASQGCSVMQGYFISRPIPADDLPAFLRAYRPPVVSKPGSGRREL